jgi:hypothetical protein
LILVILKILIIYHKIQHTLVSVVGGETDDGLLFGNVLMALGFIAGLSSTSGLIPNSALSLLK